MKYRSGLVALLLAGLLAPLPVRAQVRIKDITDLEGARSNQLYGFGLVVGLDRTGSRSTFTQQVAVDMLQRMGVTAQIFSLLPSDNVIRSTSISAVMVTAEIGPFSRKGSRIDVTVSALDDAVSLQGGTLVMTPLCGADAAVYATAQGPLSVGGFAVSGLGARLQRNQVNVGRIPGGGLIEKEALGEVLQKNRFRLLVKEADYNTARLIAKAINERNPNGANAEDGGTISICVPINKANNPQAFVSKVGLYEIFPDIPARVVINERTGTIVAGENVTISTTAVAHGNLFIVSNDPIATQPNPLPGGIVPVFPRNAQGQIESTTRVNALPKSVTVSEMARGLNSIGVTPRDLISIFQAMKQAGALHAEILIQ